MRAPHRPFVAVAALLATALPLTGQSVLERSPNLDGAWVGTPGSAYVVGPHRFVDGGAGIEAVSTFGAAFALPHSLLFGIDFSPESPLAAIADEEWQGYARWTPLREGDAPLELGVTGAYNTASSSLDAAIGAARWLGPLRILAEGRLLSDTPLDDGAEFAAGAGVVLHLLPGRMPVALAADWTTLLDRPDGIDAAWSAGLQIGVPFTQQTLSLHASNSATSTLLGRSFGFDETFYGLELTIPLGVGGLFGMYAPREQAMRAVVADPDGRVTVHARIARYAFEPHVIEIRAGDVIEWTNQDGMLHTVNAEDGAWHSGAIPPGQAWRARFDAPGRYPFYCGPHPFMKGMVVVRG
jgi:plastocyanin